MYKRIHIFVQIKRICKLEKMKNFYKSPYTICAKEKIYYSSLTTSCDGLIISTIIIKTYIKSIIHQKFQG